MLKRTGYLYDDRYLLHNPGEWHPERPDRLRAIQSHLKEMELMDLLEPL